MHDYEAILRRSWTIHAINRIWIGVSLGRDTRKGQSEAHIAELEKNLAAIQHRIKEEDYWKLKILIHTHDTFKADAIAGVSIAHPSSHSSLACRFLADHCDDPDLIAMVRYHDEPFALWRQMQAKGVSGSERLSVILNAIQDWNLFLAFSILDGCTQGKDREPLRWFFELVQGKAESDFTDEDIL